MTLKDQFRSKRKVNAFGGNVTDYDRLMTEFGIKPIKEVISKLPKKLHHFYMTRNIMFGHTLLEHIIEAILKNKPFAVMTGIKPSSPEYHIGSLITCTEAIYFQKLGGKMYFCIADLESYIDGRIPLDQAEKNAIYNVADLIALGLDFDQAYVYRQSKQKEVLKLGYLLSSHATYNMMKAIYGEHKIGIYNAAFIQVADILLPQVLDESLPTITPIGADQAPHARLSHDLARKRFFQKRYGFILPSFTYHMLMPGLYGSEKMAKRNNASVLTLFETQNTLNNKIMNAFTGGQISVEEQRIHGGKPEICRIFDLYKFFFEHDDEKLAQLKDACCSGQILCGDDKKELLALIQDFIDQHREKRARILPKAEEIVLEMAD